MRTSRGALLLALLALGCGQKVDHPDAVGGCDPATMDCVQVPPETGGGPIGGGDGGAPGDNVSDWSGQVRTFRDDNFDPAETMLFTGVAQVSAIGRSGIRVGGRYDGSSFELQNVLKTASNWFLVEPTNDASLLPTLSVIDTRSAKADELIVGVVRELEVERIFQLSLAGEPAAGRAQVVLRVVDTQGRSVPGVVAQLAAEVIAYRLEQTWDASEGASTDESGLIFLGNVPATSSLGSASVNLAGAASGRVDLRVRAGTVTVVTAIGNPP